MSQSVICGKCKTLVPIEERRYAAHDIRPGESCPIAGAIYHPAVIHKSGGGPPRIELTSARKVDCPGCGKHQVAEIRFRVSGQKAGMN